MGDDLCSLGLILELGLSILYNIGSRRGVPLGPLAFLHLVFWVSTPRLNLRQHSAILSWHCAAAGISLLHQQTKVETTLAKKEKMYFHGFKRKPWINPRF